MGLLGDKGWQALEYYNLYLDLKVDISERVQSLEYIKGEGNVTGEAYSYKDDRLKEKVNQLRFVLNELKNAGVSMEDLILLSCGVDSKEML
ncbi:hypothetical protein O2313_04965 [Bacillus amyloliquefaciens]|uniref:hypothetical protein n=1 Tax=Bacillus amyloliquefaciens TaxID=1390 RepID=UPI0022B0000A|nr:hypothetical protein [Bacillus amyloliquefaciens]MCZ4246881.1 hypothetical protein [Bacillus amyloliquefaciens]